mgnify:CR=1 FL=1
MRHQEILFSVAGQTFFYDPPEGRPSGTPTVSVYDATSDDGAPADTATTGACSVDAVSTTVAVAASVGDQSISVASATGISIGRRYLLTNAGGESESAEVKSIAGVVIGLRRPILNDQTTAATFAGTRVSIAVDSTWSAAVGNLTEWEAGHSGYRLRWAYTVAGVARIGVSFADLVRYSAKNLATGIDVDRRFPGWLDRLGPDDVEDQGAALVEEAFQAVRLDALGDEQVLRRIRNTEVLRDLVIYRAAWMAVEAQAIAGASNADAVAVVRDAYNRRYNQLLREPKVPVDPAGGGAGGHAVRSPMWRR